MSGGSFKGSTRTVQGTSLQLCIRLTMCSEDPLKELLGQYKGYQCFRVTMCLEYPLWEVYVLGQYKGHPLNNVLG